MINVLKPPKLNKGDTIGIVATSFLFPTDMQSDYYKQYQKGVEEINKMGFKTKEGQNLGKVQWWAAGTAQERASDINSMFADPEVKAIIDHDGGQSAIAILELLDFDLIKANPKPFMGFSDITNILFALFTQTGLVGFHMDLLTYGLGWVWQDIVPEQKEEGRKLFYDVLTSTNAPGVKKPLTKWECWNKGKAKGRLIGGNLSMLSSLMGTRYFPELEDFKGSIFFWETNNTESYRIERGLYQLRYSGVLDVIGGMMIGKLPDIKKTGWEGVSEPTPKEIILTTLKDCKFPILAEVDFGHKTVNIPMPIGLMAEIDAENLKLEVLEPAVI